MADVLGLAGYGSGSSSEGEDNELREEHRDELKGDAEAGAEGQVPGAEGQGAAIPPRPDATLASAALQEKVVRFLHMQESRGITVLGEMRKSKKFRNPYFLDKMVRHIGIRDGDTLLAAADRVADGGGDHDRVVAAPGGGIVFLEGRDGGAALEKSFRDAEAARVQRASGEHRREIAFVSGGEGGDKRKKKRRWE